MNKNPYLEYLKTLQLARQALAQCPPPEPVTKKVVQQAIPKGTVMLFSPHPDDECITGALALRLLREGWEIINVPVTLGSNRKHKARRLGELGKACAFLGFKIEMLDRFALDDINPKARKSTPVWWSVGVEKVAYIIRQQRPEIIFFPHGNDYNLTHVGTNLLVIDALKVVSSTYKTFQCHCFETEYWHPMDARVPGNEPNLVVEVSDEDLATLIKATHYHVDEVARNPYHLYLPDWMRENVRRGSEVIGGQGVAARPFNYGTIYRHTKWTRRGFTSYYQPTFLPKETDPELLFLP